MKLPATLTRYGVPGWGVGELWTEGDLVLAHDFLFGAANGGDVERGPACHLAERLSAFLRGEDVGFDDVELDFDGTTPFQRDVAQALRRLKRGEVLAYGEVAAAAGYPRAGRAVGTFCAHNRFMFILPCHRVVGASGIGGYGSAGVAVKRRLLALEGVRL